MPTEREHAAALTDALKELDLIRIQLNESRLRGRTTRFYEILLARSSLNERSHVGDAIELSQGWCVVHWILGSRRSIDLYRSVDVLRIAMALNGQFILSLVDVAERLDPLGKEPKTDRMTSKPLTPTEQSVILHVGLGMTNKEIGRKLSLGDQSVKNALSKAYVKLHVQTRTEAALMMRDLSLLPDYDG